MGYPKLIISAMAITTSINIQPLKSGSEAHNLRSKKLHYVREDLLHLNESWSSGTIEEKLKDIKTRYQNSTGQKMQKKATPVREGVVVIASSTTMQQLRDFAFKVEQRFGIKAFQIFIHKDEGHSRDGDWKANLHAHILFDWTQDNGKSIKLNKYDMSELQNLLAQTLQLERGRTSDVEHLSALQFKNKKEAEKKKKLQEEVDELELRKAIKTSIINSNRKSRGFIGISEHNAKMAVLEDEIKKLRAHVEMLELSVRTLNNVIKNQYYKNNSLKESYNSFGKFIEDIVDATSLLTSRQLEQVEALCPPVKELKQSREDKKEYVKRKELQKKSSIRSNRKI